jgi:hypothetical protein
MLTLPPLMVVLPLPLPTVVAESDWYSANQQSARRHRWWHRQPGGGASNAADRVRVSSCGVNLARELCIAVFTFMAGLENRHWLSGTGHPRGATAMDVLLHSAAVPACSAFSCQVVALTLGLVLSESCPWRGVRRGTVFCSPCAALLAGKVAYHLTRAGQTRFRSAQFIFWMLLV